MRFVIEVCFLFAFADPIVVFAEKVGSKTSSGSHERAPSVTTPTAESVRMPEDPPRSPPAIVRGAADKGKSLLEPEVFQTSAVQEPAAAVPLPRLLLQDCHLL